MVLIDLDAAAGFGEGNQCFAGAKYSTAYVPPELLMVSESGKIAVRVPYAEEKVEPPPGVMMKRSLSRRMSFRRVASAKSVNSEMEVSKSYAMVKADPSFDMWSLGALLYLLCTGMNLFRATVEDNIGSDVDLHTLMDWTNSSKTASLASVSNKLARNLISLLLQKDPSKRLNCSRVLAHPFLTGKSPGRLQGESAQFDVFLSYRVSSDSDKVAVLHDRLEARGLKVWWDKKCLLPGQGW